MIGKYVVLTKLSDDMFGGFHPNGIDVGSKLIQGYLRDEPTPNKQLFLYPSLKMFIQPNLYTFIVNQYYT